MRVVSSVGMTRATEVCNFDLFSGASGHAVLGVRVSGCGEKGHSKEDLNMGEVEHKEDQILNQGRYSSRP